MDFDFYRAEIFGKIEERRGAIAKAMATMSDKELDKKIKREKLKFRRVEHLVQFRDGFVPRPLDVRGAA